MSTTTGTATLVRRLTGWNGDARLYRLYPPVENHRMMDDSFEYVTETVEYVIVSAVVVQYSNEPETYIFPAGSNGKTISMIEMSGSFHGGLGHARALRGLGYEITDPVVNGALRSAADLKRAVEYYRGKGE